MAPSTGQLDRAIGAVVGAAAGDALGAPFEFGPPLPADRVVEPVGGGPFGWEPGEWTDDTQMTCAVLAAIAPGKVDLGTVASAFLSWFGHHPRDVGNQTRAVLSSAASPAGLASAAARFQASRPDAAGNGSLMRTGPVPLAGVTASCDLAATASAVSALTHPHDDCFAACVLWCDAIRRLITRPVAGPPAEGWINCITAGVHLLEPAARERWATLLGDVASRPASAFAERNGWVVDALRCALAAITETPVPAGPAAGLHLRRALRHAVRQGGDTDTVAAIAGSLLGARWGASTIPEEWTTLLHGWPGYRAADLVRLASEIAG